MLSMMEEVAKFRQGLRNEGKADAVLKVLEARGIVLTEEVRQRILSCTDPGLLDLWIKRAVLAHSIDEVLQPAG